jgi:hypothetical protein
MTITSIINQRTNIKWDSFHACEVAEGFGSGEEAFDETVENGPCDETVEAWAYLIKTGQCWHLQGWYGRSVRDIIEGGTISPDGVIDWELVDAVSV